ncbi:MAG: hypothetical protein HY899_02960 [Deltaproteobacteria bacterium]|nr:hypothetical protein [Deltaproteobacteria bacterium]
MSAAIGASVRMYRQGLGDCFLVTFRQGMKQAQILIDCGVVLGAPKGQERTAEVVERLAEDCGGWLDVVVVTHEHWDHVSGFKTAREIFEEKIDIGEIWMAWTEDPEDRLAAAIRRERGERVKKLGAALRQWQAVAHEAVRPDDRDDWRSALARAATESLLDFFGPGDLSAKGDKTREALSFLKDHAAPKKYLSPGDEGSLPRVGGVRVYVLGPPRDREAIKKDLPSKRDPETYEEGMRLSASASFLAAAAATSGSEDGEDERYKPFDAFFRVSPEEAQTDHFFVSRYGFNAGSRTDAPDSAPIWRRIEEDWLALTSELALMLDSDTNNTSLVLAFELGEGGDVLLFAADAQVGNWMSWDSAEFDRDGIDAADLLSRTVFYKVGHHASHNATLREKGLERMKSRRLSAFIPVHQTTANKIGWSKMPFGPLLERLQEKCRHRIVRLDRGVDDEASQAFTRSIEEHDLFFEIKLGAK